MNRIVHWVAELLWPFYCSPLSFPEESLFLRTEVFRNARLARTIDTDFGVFALIGISYASRIGRAWRPREIHLLEDISLAFHAVDDRASDLGHVPDEHQIRLTDALVRYFDYLCQSCDRDELLGAIARHIEETRLLSEDDE